MPLSWNEIRHRAIAFSKAWRGETREAAERQSFWNDFFNVFGVRRRTVASFEGPVRKLSGDWGYIDLFWPGRLLAEHKSAGADLSKAHAQGIGYIRGLKDTGRDREIPRWLIVSDFARIALHDLEPEDGARTFLSAVTSDERTTCEPREPGGIGHASAVPGPRGADRRSAPRGQRRWPIYTIR
jgi:hypothetical protein